MDGVSQPVRPGAAAGTSLADALLDHIGEALLVVDRGLTVLHGNEHAARLAGRPADALPGRRLAKIWPHVASGPGAEACAQALGENAPATCCWQVALGGATRWLALRAVPYDQGLAIFCRDDTARQEAETRLREAEHAARARERQLAQAIENTAENVFVLSPDWRITYLNQSAAADMAAAGVGIGDMLWTSFPDLAGTALQDAYQRCMAQRIPVEAELYYAPAGRVSAVRAFPVENDGIAVFYRDVTEIRATQERLAQTQGMLRGLGDSTSDMLFVKDRAGRMLYANPACLELIGRPEADVIGNTDAKFLRDARRRRTSCATTWP